MQPSDTERGEKWLSNFESVDRPFARLLVNSLELVGQDQLKEGLQQLIEKISQNIPRPIALVPVRELAPKQSYYKSTNRNARAPLLLPTSFPGSEAIAANIAGGLRRQNKNAGPFVASPSLKNLRDSKCRSILFIDDFSGSGNRLLNFREKYQDHPTLRSWESYKLIEYHVATYAMTKKAHDRLSKVFGEGHVHTVKMCPVFSTQPWTDRELAHIERICNDYCSRSHNVFPLGYENTRGLMAFSHSAPNNLPGILWQQYAFGFWHPFFSEKSVPNDLLPLFKEPTNDIRLQNSMLKLGQVRLAEGHWRNEAPKELKAVLLVLAAIARRPRHTYRIAELTQLTNQEIILIIENCRRWGLVGAIGLHLTESGLAELKHAKGISLPDERVSLNGSTEFYYPSSLRVGR